MTMSDDGGDAEACANAARVLAYHRGQHADCVTCRLMAERDNAEAERDRLRKRTAALEAVVERVPEWRLFPVGVGEKTRRHCAICRSDKDKGHAAGCPWLGLRETDQSAVSL